MKVQVPMLIENSIENEIDIEDEQPVFDVQLKTFMEMNMLTKKEFRTRYIPVIQDLNKIFKPHLPKCFMHCFGSTMCGLATKNSDLDISFNTGLPINENSPNWSLEDFTKTMLQLTKTILLEDPTKFTQIRAVSKARVPVVKFLYKPTNVSCDMSFHNSLAVYNTQLIKGYINSHPFFQPVMIIIKSWIDKTDLKNVMSKYTLTMLFIFYLQQINLVPAVADVKKRFHVPIKIGGWQVYYDKGIQDINVKSCDKSVPDLLIGFFMFYSKYNFQKNVVCINDGKSYDKRMLKSKDNIPDSLLPLSVDSLQTEELKKIMFVQDPIELNLNIAKNMVACDIEKFRYYCSLVYHSSKYSLNENYINLFNQILNFKMMIESKEICDQITKVKYFNVQSKMLSDVNSNINIELCFNKVINAVQSILEKLLFFKVKKTNDDKVNGTVTFQCQCFYDLWSGREKTLKSSWYFVKDKMISKSMLQKLCLQTLVQEDNEDNFALTFFINFKKEMKPHSRIYFTVTTGSCSRKKLNSFVQFLMSRLEFIITKKKKIDTDIETKIT